MRADAMRNYTSPVALAVAGLGVLTFLAWLVLALVFSPGFVTDKLAAAVKTATGRTLTVGGTPTFTLWPQVQVSLPDVRLSNPPGMFEGQIAEARRLTITMTAAALFNRRLEISQLRLEAPRLSLVIDEAGRANWTSPSGSGTSGTVPQAAAQKSPLVALPPLLIEDGDVRFLDQRSGKTFAAGGVDLSIKLGEDAIAADVRGALNWNRDRIGFAAYIKNPARLSSDGSPIDITAQAARGSLSFSGQARLTDGFSLAGQADATVPSLREAVSWLGADVGQGAGFGVASMSGPLEITPGRAAMKAARFTVDGMNATGDAALAFGARPKLEARLGMDRLDLNRWFPPAASEAGGTAGAAGSGDPGWSDARIDFSGLRGLDARFTLVASELIWRDLKIGGVEVNATIVAGRLTAELARATLYGGKATARLALDGSGAVPAASLAFAGTHMDGLSLLRSLAHVSRISGQLDADADLKTSGKTQREMVARLAGSARFAFSEGALRGIDVRGLNAAVVKSVLQGWSAAPGEMTAFDRLTATFTLADGIADSKTVSFEAPGLTVTGAGQADLLKGELDFRLKPRVLNADGTAQTAGLNGLNLAVAVVGPWDDPKIYPDMPGILDNPQAAFEQINTLLATTSKEDAVNAATALVKKKGKKLLDKLLKTPEAPAP